MIVVYYGVNLSLFLSSFSPSCFPSSSSFTASHSRPLPCFSRFLYALCLCPNLHPPSLPLAIFLHLELSLFCLFSIPRPSVNLARTPSLSYHSFPPASQSRRVPPALALPLLFFFPSSSSSGLSISPGLAPSFSFSFSSGLYFSAPDVPPVANIVFLPPPLIWLKRQFVLF